MLTPSVLGWWAGTRLVITLAALTALVAAAPIASSAAEAAPSGQASNHEQRIKELEETVNQLKKDERQTEITLENLKPLAAGRTASRSSLRTVRTS